MACKVNFPPHFPPPPPPLADVGFDLFFFIPSPCKEGSGSFSCAPPFFFFLVTVHLWKGRWNSLDFFVKGWLQQNPLRSFFPAVRPPPPPRSFPFLFPLFKFPPLDLFCGFWTLFWILTRGIAVFLVFFFFVGPPFFWFPTCLSLLCPASLFFHCFFLHFSLPFRRILASNLTLRGLFSFLVKGFGGNNLLQPLPLHFLPVTLRHSF